MGSQEASQARSPGAWPTLATVTAAQFLVVVSTSIVSVALPTMQNELDASETGSQWIINTYVLVFASLLVTGGVIADRYGRRATFLAGLGFFAVGSAVCGLAPSFEWLLAGRLLQGLGPALIQPAGLGILRVRFDDARERSLAIGLYSASSGVALALGPTAGGLLVDGFGWRSIFLVNLPIVAVIVSTGTRVLAHVARPGIPTTRFDWRGVFLASTAMTALCAGLIEGQDLGWTSPVIVAAFVAGAAAIAGLVACERRAEAPMLDVALFRVRAYVATNLVGLVVFFAFIGATVYLSIFFQEVQGHSATRAGLSILPIGCGVAVAAPLAARLVNAFGSRLPIVTGLFLGGCSLLALLRLGAATGFPAIWWNLGVLGFGVGLAVTPLNNVVVSMAESDRAGVASGVLNTMRQFGQLLGVAVFGAIVFSVPASGDPSEAFVQGLHLALWAAGGALLATAAMARAALPRFPERSRDLAQTIDVGRHPS